jgi:hypothetical protein
MTQPSEMTSDEFRETLQEIGVTQTRFAALAGIDERTSRRYASGALAVTKLVRWALIGMLHPTRGVAAQPKRR